MHSSLFFSTHTYICKIGERDSTLPQNGIMTWGNLGSAWIISNVDARFYEAVGGKAME